MADVSLDEKFEVLSAIARAQHFAWRGAVADLFPDQDPRRVTLRMWERTGEQTARSYVRRIDESLPIAPQLAACIVWSSRCMGEDASVEPGASPEEAFVRHRGCPWLEWHRRLGLLEEDRPGCDTWFRSTAAALGRALGTELHVETLEALPDGGESCLRRIRAGR